MAANRENTRTIPDIDRETFESITGQLHGEMYTLKNQKLACCHIHISTVILPLQSEKNTLMLS
jgi:hypothetical protein